MSSPRRTGAAFRRRLPRQLVGSALLVLAAGCEDLISVIPIDRVSTSALFDDPAQATLLLTSVQGQFECAFSSYVLATGLLGGEVNSIGNTQLYTLDRREPDKSGGVNTGLYANADCGTGIGIGTYVPLSTARWFADRVRTALEGWSDAEVPGRSGMIATANAYAGYSLILLGEGFCSAAIDLGPELTPAQTFAVAEERFTSAITAAEAAGGTTGADILAMARVGRARARLNQGNTTGALSDALAVPADYVKNATRALGVTSRENVPYVHITRALSAAIAPEFWDVRFNGKKDPRVTVDSVGVVTSTGITTPRMVQRKYPNEAAPIPIATGIEAQLIVAEIQGGQQAVDIINAIHAANGLDPFVSTDAAEIQAQVREERRRSLFLDGHRSYDRIRFDVPLDPPPGAPYRWGGIYGAMKCMPLPDNERNNNPNI
jgi:hypothetical protein